MAWNPAPPFPPMTVTLQPWIMSSAHRGIVVVTFFDNHGEKRSTNQNDASAQFNP
jgi:hypothetical protein